MAPTMTDRKFESFKYWSKIGVSSISGFSFKFLLDMIRKLYSKSTIRYKGRMMKMKGVTMNLLDLDKYLN